MSTSSSAAIGWDAAIIFWWLVAPADVQSQSHPADAATHSSATGKTGESPKRLTGMARDGGDAGATPPEPSSQVKGAAEFFHETIGKLKDLNDAPRRQAIDSLIKQLRAMGPEGLQVLRNYFRAGQDVSLGLNGTNRDGVMTRNLRTLLMDKLSEWPASETSDLAREIMQTTRSFSEAAIAIGNLEKGFPGMYRNEAIQTLLKLAALRPERDYEIGDDFVISSAIKGFKALELLPVAEDAANKRSSYIPQLVEALDALPADARGPVLQRLFDNGKMAEVIAKDDHALWLLNFSEPDTLRNTAQVFAANTDRHFREKFLTDIASKYSVQFYGDGSSSGNMKIDNVPDRIARLKARLVLLDTIAPQCDTAVQQERLQDARDSLQTEITKLAQQGK